MKVAVVTGAGSGIGRATAQLLAARRYAVACADLDRGSAAETAAGVADAMAVQLDVRDADSIARAIAYLASDEAAFVTGTALVIDGGLTAA